MDSAKVPTLTHPFTSRWSQHSANCPPLDASAATRMVHNKYFTVSFVAEDLCHPFSRRLWVPLVTHFPENRDQRNPKSLAKQFF